MKIQLKRSNQLEGGSAKEPTAAQMEFGELAVNYNDEDPAIFIKDSDDNIIRIAGVGSISSGDVPSGGSGDKPDAPSVGDLYFDTDLNILLYWNGNEWIEISPTLVADGSTAALPDATEHGEGTLWWDSDAASGKLFICYDDPGQGKVWVEASPMPNGGALPDISDPNNQGGTLDSRYVRADVTDHKQGNLTIGDGPGNNNIRLNEDGSAAFAANVDVGNGSIELNVDQGGRVNAAFGMVAGDFDGTSDSTGVYLQGNDTGNGGRLVLQSSTTASNYASFSIIRGAGDQKVTISNDGSASFDGNVTSTYSGSANSFQATGNITGSAAHYRSNVTNNGSASDYHLYCDANDGKIVSIATDGSATFAADATINGVTVGRGGGSNSGNTAVGTSALFSNTTGTYNTAVGTNALYYNTEGNSNTSVGRTALNNTTTGSDNTAVGRRALNNNNTGALNTAVGRNAGYYIQGSNNTILGPYLGTEADATLNDTVIISAGSTQRMRIDSSGDVLIGDTLPSAPNISLGADGSAEFAGGSAKFGAGGDLIIDTLYTALNIKRDAAASSSTYLGSFSNDTESVVDFYTNGNLRLAGDIEMSTQGSGDYKTFIYKPGTDTPGFISFNTTSASITNNPTASIFNCFDKTTNTPSVVIFQDGSATFAGEGAFASAVFNGNNSSDIAISTGYWPAEGSSLWKTGAGNNLLTFVDAASDSEASIVIGTNSNEVNLQTAIGNRRIRLGSPGGLNVFQSPNIDLNGDDGSATFVGDATISGVRVGRGGGSVTSNTAVGLNALFYNTTGENNTAVGDAALGRNVEGEYNTIIGAKAGFYIRGDNNTILGAYKGVEADAALNDTVIISAGTTKRMQIDENGDTTFYGDINADNITLNLEPDNDANYITTTDSEGNETSVYNGPTLNVQDRLTKADAALQTLKTAAAAAADFAELKAAIATALADI